MSPETGMLLLHKHGHDCMLVRNRNEGGLCSLPYFSLVICSLSHSLLPPVMRFSLSFLRRPSISLSLSILLIVSFA